MEDKVVFGVLNHGRDLFVIDSDILAIELGDELFKVVLEVRVGAFHRDGLLGIQVLISKEDSIPVHFPPFYLFNNIQFTFNLRGNFPIYKFPYKNLLQIMICIKNASIDKASIYIFLSFLSHQVQCYIIGG